MREKSKEIRDLTIGEFIAVVSIGLLIWRVPPLFLDLGAISVGLLVVIGFGFGYLTIKLLRRKRK